MLKKLNDFLKKKDILEFGNKIFLLGVLFLPSALPISIILFLPSLFIGFLKKDFYIFKDKWNYPLLVSIGIILFSSLNISFLNKDLVLNNYDISLIWINLFNWLPIFFYFWGFQIYLKKHQQRIIFAKILLLGSIPVIVSFALQFFFKIYGPFKTFFDLIVWYQKPLVAGNFVAGLFSNPNYASIWLGLVLPFAVFFLNRYKKVPVKAIFLLFLCVSLIYCIFLTGSRNGILSLGIISLFIFGYRKFFLFSFSFISIYFLPKIYPYFYDPSNRIYLIGDKFLLDFTFQTPRIDIWRSALLRIQERPFWGWGGSTFPYLHLFKNETFMPPKNIILAQHSHNIVLELSHNFGIPLTILMLLTMLLLIYKSLQIIYFSYESNNKLLLEKVWLTSIIIFLSTHLTDITFYDGKISILISILFSGLKCILDNKISNKKDVLSE